MSKTLGNELYDLLNPYDPSAGANPATWDQTDEDFQAHYERCAVQFRDAVIEECAKVADDNWQTMKMVGHGYADGACDAGERIARSIRALKSKTPSKEAT